MTEHAIALTINGTLYRATVEPRLSLVDFIRDVAGLTGTHVGCEHGVCGACTVTVDGAAVRGCLMFAVQAEGLAVETVEGLTEANGALSPLQDAFIEAHAMQCGYCTPGMLLSARELLADNPDPTEAEIRDAIAGNLCRCTGYGQIVEAIQLAAARLRQGAPA